MLTRKDFQRIAAEFHDLRKQIKADETEWGTDFPLATAKLDTLRKVENRLISLFQEDNPLFDQKRYLIASGGNAPDTV